MANLTVWTGATEQDWPVFVDEQVRDVATGAFDISNILYGSGPPLDTQGRDGEHYECCVTGRRWGPKRDGRWPENETVKKEA